MSAATVSTDAVVSQPLAAPRARLAPVAEPPARMLAAVGPVLAPVPAAGSREAADRDSGSGGAGGRPTVSHGSPQPGPLPDPTPLCCSMVQAAVEALRGTRPLSQLARWVLPEIYEQLALRSELTQRVLGRDAGTHRATIRRIRLCRLGDSTAEATVIVDDGPRVRAVAVRLEGHRGQWRATALEIG